jgi:hypothetical protein
MVGKKSPEDSLSSRLIYLAAPPVPIYVLRFKKNHSEKHAVLVNKTASSTIDRLVIAPKKKRLVETGLLPSSKSNISSC